MRALVHHRYGDPAEVLRVEQVDLPLVPAGHVRVRVAAASVNAADWHMIRGTPFPARFVYGGPFAPKRIVPGSDMVGVVEAVGAGVVGFAVGDRVMGELSLRGMGAFAEYVNADVSMLVKAPATMDDIHAAALPMGSVTALVGLRDHVHLQPGERILITGAAGGVGSAAVSLALHMGAHVTAMCRTEGVEAVRALGAHEVIDRTVADVADRRDAFDAILECAGYKAYRRLLPTISKGGRYVFAGGSMRTLASVMAFGALHRDPTVKNFLIKTTAPLLEDVRALAEQGALRPIIDSVVSLEQGAAAVSRVDRGKAVGKVVITME
jgi:NADPH:quinone reductase-like Zn-dependent oxidoreductase